MMVSLYTELAMNQPHSWWKSGTGAGEGHAAILLLGGRALVGSSGSDGEGGGGRQGTAVVIHLPTRGHHHAVVVGKQGELYGPTQKGEK